MAAGVIPILTPTLAGIEATDQAATATDGDDFVNDGRTVLFVRNTSTAQDITITSSVKCEHGTQHDLTVSALASKTTIIGPFPTSRFGTSVHVLAATAANIFLSARRVP